MPVLAQILSRAAMLDGVRHYILVFPAIALLGGYAGVEAGRVLSARAVPGRRVSRRRAAAASRLALALLVRTIVALHPYEVVFFNRLAGGPQGAREKFELDYWGVSFKQAAAWMNANLPEGTRVLLTMQAQHFLHIDPGRLHFVPDLKRRPNVKVNLIRGILKSNDPDGGDYLHPVEEADLRRDGGRREPPRDLRLPAERGPARRRRARARRGRRRSDEGRRRRGGVRRPRLRGARGAPYAFEAMGFDCGKNPYNERTVALRITGDLRVPADDDYEFELRSDDDAFLFVNGALAIGNGSGATSRRYFRLERGVYRLRLDYRNDVGRACLDLRWRRGRNEPLRPVAAPDLVRAASR